MEALRRIAAGLEVQRKTNDRSKRIAMQLGMPHGTAANKLRKLVLFNLLKKHNENVCFKCGGTIESANFLSIEHKEDWEGVSAELFWDMNNIAFSHVGCNRPKSNGHPPMEMPPGKNWCYSCKDFRPNSEFHINLSLPGRLADRCKTCKSKENERRVR